jgi:hypothetical protein
MATAVVEQPPDYVAIEAQAHEKISALEAEISSMTPEALVDAAVAEKVRGKEAQRAEARQVLAWASGARGEVERREFEAARQALIDQRSAILKGRDARRAELVKTAAKVNASIRSVYAVVLNNEKLVEADIADGDHLAGVEGQLAELEGREGMAASPTTVEHHPMGGYRGAFEALAPSSALYTRLGFEHGDPGSAPLAEE